MKRTAFLLGATLATSALHATAYLFATSETNATIGFTKVRDSIDMIIYRYLTSLLDKAEEQPSVAYIAANYHSFNLITPTPVLTDSKLLLDCTAPSQASIAENIIKEGPHGFAKVSIFMNDLATQAYLWRGATYPVGSVIIKEKSVSNAEEALARGANRISTAMQNADDIARLAGSGGMIKRSPGYDTAHGDWEYLYFTDLKAVQHGKISSCSECHQRAAKTDYVYGSWSTGH